MSYWFSNKIYFLIMTKYVSQNRHADASAGFVFIIIVHSKQPELLREAILSNSENDKQTEW